jgi:hypothetical protein
MNAGYFKENPPENIVPPWIYHVNAQHKDVSVILVSALTQK